MHSHRARGIGTSPALIQAVAGLGWYYLFRVQNRTRWRDAQGTEYPVCELLPATRWRGNGHAFKKAGWLATEIHVLCGRAYREPWCVVTNCPGLDGWEYAKRYWQQAAFRDLKSDGWQWQTSRIFTPAHANLLVLVLSLAYAWLLTLGTLAFDDPTRYRLLAKGKTRPYSLFRLGLRLIDHFFKQTLDIACSFFNFPDRPSPRPKTVGA
ncbi:MAG: transposase family protein [Aggregatilineales bacterium]